MQSGFRPGYAWRRLLAMKAGRGGVTFPLSLDVHARVRFVRARRCGQGAKAGRSFALLVLGLAMPLLASEAALANPLPYTVPVTLPAAGASPAVSSAAPFTPTVKSLVAQLLPSNPPTPAELMNAATVMHGTATVPLVSNQETCNTIGGNLAPTGTMPVIAPLCWADAQGVNVENGSQVRQTTAPPLRVAMSSSWDPSVLNAWGQVEGREGRYLGVTGIYAPQSDLIRVPDFGRNLTVFGEDPFQDGTMAAAEVNGIQSKGLMAQVKHFAFYTGQFAVFGGDSQVQDQAAHELYLQPYEYGTTGSGVLPNPGQSASMMCSYARFELTAAPGVNGAPPSDLSPPGGEFACDNPIKNDVAYRLWKWQGFFASDYDVAMDSTVQAMNSGTAQEMPTDVFYGDPLVAAVESGAVPLDTFKLALARILYQEERFHLLGHADGNSNYLSPSNPTPPQNTASGHVPPPDTPSQPGLTAAMKSEDAAVTERAAEESAVLLKNAGGALPLTSADLQKGVLVVGDAAEYMPADPGSEQADGYLDRDAVSPLEQLKQFAPSGSKITFSPYMPGTAPTASDGEAVPQSVLSSDGTTIGNGLTRIAGPGAPRVDPQIDFTSLSGHDQLAFGQTYTWTGYVNVPTSDDYTFRFQFSVPKFTVPNSTSNTGGGLNPESCSGTDSNSGGIAPTFMLATTAGTGQSMSSETLAGAPPTLATIPTTPTMSGNIERGLADCVFNASSLSAGVHQIQISWTTPASFDNDPYHLREPGSTMPSFRFAYSRANGDKADAIAAAKRASKVIVFADCTCVGEGTGTQMDVNTLDSGPTQLIDDMAAANPSTTVVTNFDVATLMPWLSSVKAVLQTWYPGSEGGTATARLLLGLANPRGHLTSTWPKNSTDTIFGYDETKPLYPGDTTGTHPERTNGTSTSDGQIVPWTEGIYVGYRFFDREGITAMFPFGWGLSYTTFRYSRLSVTPAGAGENVSFSATNTGKVAAAAVPQVYIGPVSSVPAGVQQSVRSLAGFDRVTLAPGQTKHLTIHIGPGSDVDGWGNRRAFEYWDTTKRAWVAAAGQRTVWVGSADAPADLTLATLAGKVACAAPAGGLVGRSLGPLHLKMTRAQARREFRRVSVRGRRYMDFFCTGDNGIRVAYASPKLVATVPARLRARLRGRVILILTSSRHYALRGVAPGTRLAKVARRLHASRPYRVGLNTWYLTADGALRGVLKVGHGVIEEIGITDATFGQSRREATRFFRSFS